MKDRKTEIKKVSFYPSEYGWYLHVEIEKKVYGEHTIGFDFCISLGTSLLEKANRILTANQIKEVLAEMERQIDERGAGSVPGQWRALLKELTYGEGGR